MTWILLSAAIAAVWVMLGILSSERKSRIAEIELSAALERKRQADAQAQAAVTQPLVARGMEQN